MECDVSSSVVDDGDTSSMDAALRDDDLSEDPPFLFLTGGEGGLGDGCDAVCRPSSLRTLPGVAVPVVELDPNPSSVSVCSTDVCLIRCGADGVGANPAVAADRFKSSSSARLSCKCVG